jgi:gliding motility-associated protein GldL
MSIASFIASAKGKKFTAAAYGVGASIVIIGALFKIQHWPFAGVLLSVGMITEAILFALSALEKPHREFDWDIVFPALKGHDGTFDPEDLVALGIPEKLEASGVAAFGGLPEEDVAKLTEGIKKLSDTASQLANLSAVADVTGSFVKNVSAASVSAEVYAKNQSTINSSTEAMVVSYKSIADSLNGVPQATAGVVSKIEDMTKNLSSINAVYEIQLKAVTSQNETVKLLSAEWDKIKLSVNSTVNESEAYKAQAAKLTQQITNLNSIYGNMLNAMNIKA